MLINLFYLIMLHFSSTNRDKYIVFGIFKTLIFNLIPRHTKIKMNDGFLNHSQ